MRNAIEKFPKLALNRQATSRHRDAPAHVRPHAIQFAVRTSSIHTHLLLYYSKIISLIRRYTQRGTLGASSQLKTESINPRTLRFIILKARNASVDCEEARPLRITRCICYNMQSSAVTPATRQHFQFTSSVLQNNMILLIISLFTIDITR